MVLRFLPVRNRRGSSLAIVIIVFMVIMILLSSVALMFDNNLLQATRQEKKMKAHYLALSGIDLARSTLLMPVDMHEGNERSMIEYIKSNPDSYLSMDDTITIDGIPVEIYLNYDKDEKVMTLMSSAVYEDVSASLTLRMDVKTAKYKEFWD
jgi:hypothetical protein